MLSLSLAVFGKHNPHILYSHTYAGLFPQPIISTSSICKKALMAGCMCLSMAFLLHQRKQQVMLCSMPRIKMYHFILLCSQKLILAFQNFWWQDTRSFWKITFWGLTNSTQEAKDLMYRNALTGLELYGHSRGRMTLEGT